MKDYIDPLRVFRHGTDRLILGEIDGQLWASDSYWAVEIPDEQHPLARILASYNITREPGVTLRIGSTLTYEISAPLVDMAKRIKPEFDRATQPIKPYVIQGAAAYVRNSDGQMLAVFDPGPVVVSDALLALVERWAPGEWFASPGLPMAALIRKVDGRPTAALMPVRHKVSEQ